MSNQFQEVVKFSEEDKSSIKNLICPNLSNEEFILFLKVCVNCGLNPMLRQIYAIVREGRDGRKITHQVSIDGARLIAERTGCYAPGREPLFLYNDKKDLIGATSFVKKLTKDGTWHEVAATAYFNEYCPKNKDGRAPMIWEKMPHIMIAKCAESNALRKAFPAEMCGIYTDDEMEQTAIPEKPKERGLTNSEIKEFEECENKEKSQKILKYFGAVSFSDLPKLTEESIERIRISLKGS